MEGSSLTAATEHGDLIVHGDSSAETSHFLTKSGNVRISNMFNLNNIIVQNKGNVNFYLLDGSVRCVVQEGNVQATIESLADNSTITVKI